MEIRNAIISDAKLINDDHGVLTAWLNLDYGGECQGFGGYVLYLPQNCKYHSVWGLAGHFIWRVLEIADVASWDQLVGKTVRVKQDHTCVYAIGHIVKNDWFCPKDDFQDAHFADMQRSGTNE